MEAKTAGVKLCRELQVVKTALACILQDENPLPLHDQQARDDELSRRLSSPFSTSPSHALHSQDLSILSRLLHQVKLLEREDNEQLSMALGNSGMSDPDNGSLTSGNNMVETVVQIANSAAEAAKAAATSSEKSLEVMETLLSSSERISKHGHTHSERDDEERENINKEISRPPSSDKDLVKKIQWQNRLTHCILGIMVVGTAIWRFKLLSMFVGVKRTFSNPFQAIGDMISEGFNGGVKEDQSVAKGFQKARAVFPSILGCEEQEFLKNVEKTEHSTTEDFKVGEALTLSLDNMLSVGNPNLDNDKEDDSK